MTGGYSWSMSGQLCRWGARHTDAVNNGRHEIDQIYTTAQALKIG